MENKTNITLDYTEISNVTIEELNLTTRTGV